MAKIAFLYRSKRRPGVESPQDFSYGATGLAKLGHQVESFDGPDLAALAGAKDAQSPTPHGFWPILAKIAPWIASDLPVITLGHLDAKAVRDRLSEFDVVVATTTALSLSLGFQVARGRLTGTSVGLAMGILPDSLSPIQRRVRKLLLRKLTLATLAEAELRQLRREFGSASDIEFAGFGIDEQYWRPGPECAQTPFALAVGNDRQRDWKTLVEAWRPKFPALKIVTKLPLPVLPSNIRCYAGSLDSPAFSDQQLREMYRTALCVIVPLHQTMQPSGQSVALQAMACGAPVILSRIQGLWDTELMTDAKICSLVPPGDPAALSDALAGIFADPANARAMGMRSSELVRTRLTTFEMSGRLDTILRSRIAAKR